MNQCDESFYKFWHSLGQKPQTTLRCFERGDLYTLHDMDAFLVAKDFYQNISMVKYYRSEQKALAYISVKKSNLEFLRHFLLKRQYRIEVYHSATKSGRDNEWTLKCKASPGNLAELEDQLMLADQTTHMAGLSAVNVKWNGDQLNVSLGYCDKEGRRLFVGNFIDSVQLANLESAIVQLESHECLLPSGILSSTGAGSKGITNKHMDPTISEHLNMIFERANILVTEVEKCDFISTDVMQDLNYLLRRPGELQNLDKRAGAVNGFSCLNAIIKFLDLKADDSNASAYSIHWFSLDNFVRLDTAATRALHLLPTADEKNRYQSVYGVLNNCRTQQGQRLLSQWLRQPLTDVHKIDERLDLVESMINETSVRQSLHDDFLRRLPDFLHLVRKLQRKRGTCLQDVFRIYQSVTRLPYAINLLNQCTGLHSSIVQSCLVEPLQDAVTNFSKFQEMVESTVDLETVQRRNEFIIRADFDDALGDLKTKIVQLEEAIENEFQRSSHRLNLDPGKSVKLESNENLGYFMRITLKEEKILREFKSFEIIDTQKGGVRFRNNAMSQLNADYMEVKQEYTQAQQSIVDEVVRIAAGYLDPLYELNHSTALLDVIISLAVAAVSALGGHYVRPKLVPRSVGRIRFHDMRHPCLEMQDASSVIPNDVHLERDKQIFLVITGPNMGGKSTYIRAVGVIAAMAQIGSFVPCSHAELFPVDAVMARVGAADCQIRGVSTFLAEMLETSSVLRSATSNSLVIIDELGRGTSTYDGFGLAWAVASHLAGPEVGCFSLFATHFHELTSLAHQMPGRVANLRVTAQVNPIDADTDAEDKREIVMLYKVEPGVCDRSYGLDVARLAGLPEEVIEDADTKAKRDERVESLWLKLDRYCGEHGSDAKRMCLDHEPNMTSHTVGIADHLRTHLLRLLNTGSSASELATATKAMLENEISDILPVDLLLDISD